MLFIATAAKRVNAAKLSQLSALCKAHPRYSVSRGNPSRNQPALTLCFDGAREYVDSAVVDEFRRICS